jgi:hypothetical protein
MSATVACAMLVALGAAPGGASVPIASDSFCPSADAIREALLALGGDQPSRPTSVKVRSHADRLLVTFDWSGATLPESRELVVAADCQARAQSAALVIASWLGILPAATLVPSTFPAPPSDGARETAHTPATPDDASPSAPPAGADVQAAASPAQADSEKDEEGDAEQESEPESLSARSAGRTPPGPRTWLGAGLYGSAGDGLVPGLRGELGRTWPRADLDIGLLASAFVGLPHDKALAGGISSWVRPALGLAGVASLGGARIRVALDLGLLMGLTVAWGSGYPANRTDAAPTWGASAGLRLYVASARLWVELRLIDWLRAESLQHEVQPTGIVRTVDLAAREGLLTLGWSFVL